MKTVKRLIALAGQPNCGKSTVFNGLTGASQHVANYPGVTVDKMTGWFKYKGVKNEVVDLPGTYSLTSYSPEERVARDFILHEKPSVVVNVMDASNLKRCLYLSFQIMEMEIPMILELNMMDMVAKRGMRIDGEALYEKLGVPVIPTTMKSGKGKQELLEAIDLISREPEMRPVFRVDYGSMEPMLEEIVGKLRAETTLEADYPLRWLAIKLMEGDDDVKERVRQAHSLGDTFLQEIAEKRVLFEARESMARSYT